MVRNVAVESTRSAILFFFFIGIPPDLLESLFPILRVRLSRSAKQPQQETRIFAYIIIRGGVKLKRQSAENAKKPIFRQR